MKKWAYMASGILIGVVVATSGSAVAAQVKSLVGQKVSGEFTVVVNNKKLSDKGPVINGRTNAPVRAITEALGADLKVEGKTLYITTDSITDESSANGNVSSSNKYIGQPKTSLLNNKNSLENHILAPTLKGREDILAEIKSLKELEANGVPVPVLAEKEKQLKEYEADIAKYTEELRLVNEALAALEK